MKLKYILKRKIWQRHLLKLFAEDTPEEIQLIEKGEFICTIKILKCNKYPGKETILAEHLRTRHIPTRLTS